ncbi:MAG: hypothetical protein JRN52_02355 [Nitrososphaerota archaeon]|nr:hypothetical protein [Nitrososphaerota archaeon]
MVFIEDRGSIFAAPLEIVWKYLFDGEAHDAVHKSTRNPSFKPVSKTSFIYCAERNFNGNWIAESQRLSVFPPLGMSTEWLEGPFAGSKMFYLYSPKGNKTQIDVFGDFTSKTIPDSDLEQSVNKFLEREFNDDAPAIRDYARKTKKVSKKESAVFFKDVGGIFDAPIGVTWKYFFEGGEDHDNAHAKRTRNFKFKPVSESVSVMSQERKKRNRWSGETIQMTNLAPLGYVFEMLKGTITGSKMLYIYMPKDNGKTQVDVYAYLRSRSISRNRLKQEVRAALALDFKEDAPALRTFASKQ